MLYENTAGTATLVFDQPSTRFGQYGDDRVTAIARDLDPRIHGLLVRGAKPLPACGDLAQGLESV
jgi:hypothetical protein